MRTALGVAVFSGMLGVTLFGLLFTPVFYSVVMKFTERKSASAPPANHAAPPNSKAAS